MSVKVRMWERGGGCECKGEEAASVKVRRLRV